MHVVVVEDDALPRQPVDVRGRDLGARGRVEGDLPGPRVRSPPLDAVSQLSALTSFQPRSSARMNTMLGAASAEAPGARARGSAARAATKRALILDSLRRLLEAAQARAIAAPASTSADRLPSKDAPLRQTARGVWRPPRADPSPGRDVGGGFCAPASGLRTVRVPYAQKAGPERWPESREDAKMKRLPLAGALTLSAARRRVINK